MTENDLLSAWILKKHIKLEYKELSSRKKENFSSFLKNQNNREISQNDFLKMNSIVQLAQ